MDLAFRRMGSGPCVVLLHGLGAGSRVWDGLAAELARDHLVVMPDLPGHGRSRVRNGDHSLSAVATAVRDLLVVLGQERAGIVGHSLGGGVALYFAYQYPARCSHLTLMAPGGFGVEVHPALRAMVLPGAGLIIGAWTWLGRLSRRRDHAPRRVVRIATPRFRPPAAPTFLHLLKAAVGGRGQRIEARDALAVVARAVPTLVIWGRADRTIPASHAGSARLAAPDARVVVLDGIGHCPHVDDPAGTAALVRSHLRQRGGRVDDAGWARLLSGGQDPARGPEPVRAG